MTAGDHQPVGPRRVLGRVDPEVRRVLGFPQGAVRLPDLHELPWLAHPLRWARWSRLVRRDGPYAPSFEEYVETGGGRGGGRPSPGERPPA